MMMTEKALVARFLEMRKSAPMGHKTARQQLFGILFDREIAYAETNASKIAKAAGSPNAEIEINAGRNLARYVTVKPRIARRWKPETLP